MQLKLHPKPTLFGPKELGPQASITKLVRKVTFKKFLSVFNL